MLTLSLLRHAKSSWDDPDIDDFDRVLSPRGIEAAPRMGKAMRKLDLVPDLVLCSPAGRTRETLGLVRPELGKAKLKVRYEDGLYLASHTSLLDRIQKVPASAAHLMVIGHNPGLQRLAIRLAGRGDMPTRHALGEKFPTAALAVLRFEAEKWAEVKPGGGELIHFLTPRRLAASEA